MKSSRVLGFTLLIAGALAAQAQPELAQWGNLRGVRVEGHLYPLETSLQLVRSDGTVAARTAHYANPSAYTRAGAQQKVKVQLGKIACTEVVEETAAGAASVAVTMTAEEDVAVADGYFTVDLPRANFSEGKVIWLAPAAGVAAECLLAEAMARPDGLRVSAAGAKFVAAGHEWEIKADAPLEIQIAPTAKDEAGVIRVRFPVLTGPVTKGQAGARSFTLRAGGEIDHRAVNVAVDAAHPGRLFDGVGGNFRLQFPESDPAIIDYDLANLRVTWARIALWWRDWDAEESGNALAAARAGQVTPRIREQVALAQRLAQRGIPVIVSAWDPPAWANLTGPRLPGMYNDAVNPAKWQRMAESIADYLLFIKESSGVEAALFSFNEPELGLMPTAEEHVAFLKILGRALLARGLATKHLLADTSNATPKSLGFARAAINDHDTRPFLGAVGFHTWGGCENENLVQWDDVARQLGLPLLVTEGGPDAEAHKHPDMIYEPAYALDEIELYVRICALSQPTTIMHWQLTADYSLLKGGGAYGHQGPLQPTERFWNYKQLGTTPPRAFALPVRSDHPGVTTAAFGNIAQGEYVVHLVNTGAERTAVITGWPATVNSLRVYTTSLAKGMQEGARIAVSNGRAEVKLDGRSFTSVFSAH